MNVGVSATLPRCWRSCQSPPSHLLSWSGTASTEEGMYFYLIDYIIKNVGGDQWGTYEKERLYDRLRQTERAAACCLSACSYFDSFATTNERPYCTFSMIDENCDSGWHSDNQLITLPRQAIRIL